MLSTLKEYGYRPSNIFSRMGGYKNRSPPPPGESQVAICFLRNTGTDHSREAIGPKGAQLLFEGVRTALCELPLMTK